MKLFGKSKRAFGDAETLVPEVKWIPYRENGQVKYMRAEDPEIENSSATGGLMRTSKPSAYGDMTSGVGYMANAPQLLPERYTDDSLIPAIVTNIVPSMKPGSEE
jgi:hypothetical protein